MTQQNFFRHHPDPIVQILLNTELVPEKIMPAITNPIIASNPKMQALMLILLADAGLKTFEEANEFAESVYLSPCHVDLQLIFLTAWYGILFALNNVHLDHMNAIQATMNGLVTDDTLPEIKAMVNYVQAVNYVFFRNYQQQCRFADTLLEQVPKQSFYYKKFSMLRAMTFLEHGMGAHIKSTFNEIVPSEYDNVGLIMCKFINSALTGKVSQAQELIQEISTFRDHKFYKVVQNKFQMSCGIISLMARYRGVDLPSKLILEGVKDNSSWMRSTKAFLEHKPQEALH